jgi:hypothetical protein
MKTKEQSATSADFDRHELEMIERALGHLIRKMATSEFIDDDDPHFRKMNTLREKVQATRDRITKKEQGEHTRTSNS